MVKVGELSVEGSVNETEIINAIKRMENELENMKVQMQQTDATGKQLDNIFKSLTKGMVGLGLVGVGALTVLALKAPVLAGTMAKLEVQTLKLSNTVGRQLKPVFESVAGNLIPAINRSFASNSNEISIVVGKLKEFIDVLSVLIDKEGDLKSFGKEFNDFLRPSFDVTTGKPLTEMQQQDFSQSFLSRLLTGTLKDFQFGMTDPDGPQGPQEAVYSPNFSGGLRQAFDWIVSIMTLTNDKNTLFSTADGVSR